MKITVKPKADIEYKIKEFDPTQTMEVVPEDGDSRTVLLVKDKDGKIWQLHLDAIESLEVEND